jgi:hypothetical protein
MRVNHAPIEVETDCRRGVERQKLRQQQAADDRIALRLAQLRSGTKRLRFIAALPA